MANFPDGWSDHDHRAAHEQLERVLSSSYFAHAARLSRFFSYLAQETLSGNENRLSQHAIALDVFDRDETFDPAIDAVVRVEAGRLRSKLREYFSEEGRDDPVIITLPKRSYAVAFEFRNRAALEQHTPSQNAGAAPAVSTPKDMVATTAQPTIAVLPFENMSPDADQDYFADGLSEDIITDLSQLPGVSVISRHSTFLYKTKCASVWQICQELKCDLVLEGSVRKSAGFVRVNAQLIDGSTGLHIWAQRYDREIADIFKLQDDINTSIVKTLEIELAKQESRTPSARRTANIDAYDYVLRGLKEGREFSKEGSIRARYCFECAIDLDPEYSVAHARLALNHIYWWITSWSHVREDTIDKGRKLAERAVTLNDTLAIAHTALSWAHLWSGRFEEAIDAGERALVRDANDADALERQSLTLSWCGKPERALALLDDARRLNPHEPYYFPQGCAEFSAERFEGAMKLFAASTQRYPNFLPAYLLLAATLKIAGRKPDATAVGEKITALYPGYKIERDLRTAFRDEALRQRIAGGLRYAGLS